MTSNTARDDEMVNGVAVFDFDKTLIRQGSLILVLTALVGRRRFAVSALRAFVATWHIPPAERREALRSALLRACLRDVPVDKLRSAAERIAPTLHWPAAVMARYRWHKTHGHRILVASGGLAAYVPVILEQAGLGTDGILATEMVVTDNRFTGEMIGPACTKREKARRVQAWLAAVRAEEPCEVWGYGNMPSDGPMLELADHRFVVRKGTVRPLAQNA